MVCDLCNREVEDTEPASTAPCCMRIGHTQCLIEYIASNVRHYHDSICICGGILHAISDNYANDWEATQAIHKIRIEELIKQPVAKADYKKITKAISEQNKGHRLLKSKIDEKYREFSEQVSTSINLIKVAKADILASLKNTDEYKGYFKAMRRVNFYTGRFKRVYNVSDSELRAALRGVGRRRRWRFRHDYLFLRKFRIRI